MGSRPPGPAAPPAVVNEPGSPHDSAVVSIGAFGWEGDVLLVDGTVANISGPLWLGVQPTSSAPDADWRATRMKFDLGDDWDSPRPFEAAFSDAVRAERYRIKVFQDGVGFGAGAAPGPPFGDYLESGGAAKPSEILDIVLDTTP